MKINKQMHLLFKFNINVLDKLNINKLINKYNVYKTRNSLSTINSITLELFVLTTSIEFIDLLEIYWLFFDWIMHPRKGLQKLP